VRRWHGAALALAAVSLVVASVLASMRPAEPAVDDGAADLSQY
jgi:hypothetical protein